MKQIMNYKDNREQLNKILRNIESLPGGLRCNFLLTIKAHNGCLIAKQWKRKRPTVLQDNEVLITF